MKAWLDVWAKPWSSPRLAHRGAAFARIPAIKTIFDFHFSPKKLAVWLEPGDFFERIKSIFISKNPRLSAFDFV